MATNPGDTLRKVQPGEPLALSAAAYNAFVDAARAARGGGPEMLAGPVVTPRDGLVVLVRNNTGGDVPRYGVLAISSPLVAPSADEGEFQRRLAFEGSTPSGATATGRWVVLLEPLADGAIGRACLAGLTVARLSVPGSLGAFAEAASGNASSLATGSTGSARVLWAESSGTTRWAVVRLGDGSGLGGGSLTFRDIDNSPSYGSIAVVEADSADGVSLTQPSPGVVRIDLLSASVSQAGIVTTGTQTLGGDKTFADDVGILGTLSVQGTASFGVGMSPGGVHVWTSEATTATSQYWLNTSSHYTRALMRSDGKFVVVTTIPGGAGSWTIQAHVEQRWSISHPGGSGNTQFFLDADGFTIENTALGGRSYRVKINGTTYTGQDATVAGLTFTGGLLTGGSFTGGVPDGDKGDVTVAGGVWSLDAGVVDSAELADGAVGTAKIGDGAVTTGKLDANAVTTAKLDNDAVTTGKIADGQVTFAKLQAVSTDVLLGNDGSGTAVEEVACTAAGRAVIGAASAADQRAALGLAVGSDVQAYDPTLGALAALTVAANSLTVGTGADAFSQVAFAANTFPARSSSGDLAAKPITEFGLSILDDPDAATVRATIGAGTGTGSVTSVALALPGIFSVGGSPVTTSGTLTASLATQAANTVWAGPTSGGAATPAFRALATADLPDNGVTGAKLRDSAALSVIGRSANSAGDPADIAAGSDGHVLYRDGATLGFGFPKPTSGTAVGFNAYRASGLAVSNGTQTQIPFGTELFDTEGAHGAGTFTVPAGMAGKWSFAVLAYANFTVGPDVACGLYLWRNGVGTGTVILSITVPASSVGGAGVAAELAAGDTLDVAIVHFAGSTKTMNWTAPGQCSFSGVYHGR